VRIRRSTAALAAALVGLALAACHESPTAPKDRPLSLDPVVVTASSLGTGTIASRNAAGKCIDASRGSATVSVATLLEPCGTAAGQQFTWQSSGNISTFGGAMCLTDKGAKGLTYDPIIIYPCRSTTAQHWTLNSTGEIVGINGKCVSVLHAATASGSAIILYPCHNGASQEWSINGSSSTTTSTLAISKASGDNQVATYGALVTNPLVVTVRKSNGTVAPGVTVTWTATDGSVTAATTTTNSLGQAHVSFRVSPTFFISKATATAGGKSVTFTATGNGTPDLKGRTIFPASSPWNTDISTAAVDPNSAALIASCGSGNQLHPDFGTVYHGAPNGIPLIVVHSTQPKVPISFRYAGQSDPGPYPLPPNTPIQGGLSSTGDRHALVVDWEDWRSYEVFAAYPQSGGSWKAGSGAIFNLTTGTTRPAGWTSADAAGTPMVPEMVRYDEAVLRKVISHALHISCDKTRWAYVAPGRHAAGDGTSTSLPPMAMRVRLKKSVNISGFSATNQVILRALQHYGAFVADDGVGFMLAGVPDPRWSDSDLHELTKLTGASFEVVKMGPVTNVTP
jgi:plastocyanin